MAQEGNVFETRKALILSQDRDFTYDLCVVGGAGHVGLPLALVFAEKAQNVLIYDINEATLATIGSGVVPFLEHEAEPLLRQTLEQQRLTLSSDASEVGRARVVIITIGTPVDEFLNPVHRLMEECIDSLAPHLKSTELVVLRSTVFPGTTEWLGRRLQELGCTAQVAFCPERVVQGYAIREVQELPQLISGTTPEAARLAKELFELAAPSTVELTPKEAEFAKLFTNAYRYIQFAATNQFFMMAHAAGVDYHRILEGIKTDYPRAKDIPGPGFAAGPCLFKDTMQLSAFSHNNFSLGHAAMLVNEGLVLYLVEALAQQHPLPELTVGLLGMAFKAESDDIRSSLSYKLKKLLKFRACQVLTTDPWVDNDPELLPLEQVVADSDILVLCVPHQAYKGLDFGGKPVMDIWGSTRNPSSRNLVVS